ncbi:MAG: ABC transporter permease subunit [Hyphomonadaceae bacterium]|nr:MAG: oligopeptide transport system permease protein [Caulobacteraceae bacterium]MBT9444742.1 ABC transporter permease subunit [Hyphomonadaceae bacterium]TPW05958.1 MAG: oligopeptide transport system permease protein [Alphaproteobacteria bacterium]
MTDLAANAFASTPARGRSLWDDARRRLMRNPAAVVGMAALALFTVLGIVGLLNYAYPGLFGLHPVDMLFRDKVNLAPSLAAGHLLGTDTEGRDLLARILFGLGISMAVGFVATTVSLVIGVVWGATAGYVGGGVDSFMMRIVDVLYSIPFIFFVILLMVVFGSNIWLIFIAIGAVEWLTMSRIVRGQTISLRQKEFVEAAKAGGASGAAIIFRHIVPNLMGPVVVFATLNVARVILLESFLSFLGLGVQEPLTSLGKLIADGSNNMDTAPWMIVWPAVMMFATLICFNFVGDGLRDALDPKER